MSMRMQTHRLIVLKSRLTINSLMIENVNFYLGKLYSNGIPAAAHLSEKK